MKFNKKINKAFGSFGLFVGGGFSGYDELKVGQNLNFIKILSNFAIYSAMRRKSLALQKSRLKRSRII